MTDAIHISYATHEYRNSARELSNSAIKYFSKSVIYSPTSEVISRFKTNNPNKLSGVKGAGYWRWKPIIILDALDKLNEGDLVFYTDSGMNFVRNPAPLLESAKGRSVVLYKHIEAANSNKTYSLGNWAKRDALILLNADTEEFWHTTTLLGGFGIYRADDFTRKFLSDWSEAMMDDRIVTDMPNTQGKPNLPGFQAHRHDQVVLTILAKRAGIIPERDPSQFGLYEPGSPDGPIFDLHRRRDSSVIMTLRSKLQLRTRFKKLLGRH